MYVGDVLGRKLIFYEYFYTVNADVNSYSERSPK
jgi:DUF2075 family protein